MQNLTFVRFSITAPTILFGSLGYFFMEFVDIYVHSRQSDATITYNDSVLWVTVVSCFCLHLVSRYQPSGSRAGLRRRRARVQIAVATLSGNSLRQTVHTHCASVHQAAKFVAALLRVAGVTAGLAESNGSLPGWRLTSTAGWLPRTGISSETLRSVIKYGLRLPFFGGVCTALCLLLLSLFLRWWQWRLMSRFLLPRDAKRGAAYAMTRRQAVHVPSGAARNFRRGCVSL